MFSVNHLIAAEPVNVLVFLIVHAADTDIHIVFGNADDFTVYKDFRRIQIFRNLKILCFAKIICIIENTGFGFRIDYVYYFPFFFRLGRCGLNNIACFLRDRRRSLFRVALFFGFLGRSLCFCGWFFYIFIHDVRLDQKADRGGDQNGAYDHGSILFGVGLSGNIEDALLHEACALSADGSRHE